MTFSLSCLPKAPSPNAITLVVRTSTCEFWRQEHQIITGLSYKRHLPNVANLRSKQLNLCSTLNSCVVATSLPRKPLHCACGVARSEESPEADVSLTSERAREVWIRTFCLHSAQHFVSPPNPARQVVGPSSASEQKEIAVRPSSSLKITVHSSVSLRSQDSRLGLLVQHAPVAGRPGAPRAILGTMP